MTATSPALVTSKGPVNAAIDPRSGLRFYTWQGQQLMSVTSMRRLVGMPYPLANWMAEQHVKAAISKADVLAQMIHDDGEVETAKWLRKIAMGERDDAANRGTTVHDLASRSITIHDAAVMGHPAEVLSPLAWYYDFLDYSKAEILSSEKQVFNLSMGYGGSIDAILKIGMPMYAEPCIVVVDLKTGKGMYVDFILQLMAYALGEFIGENDVVDQQATDILLGAHRLGLLHLGNEGWEFVEISPTDEVYRAFRAMVTFATWQKDTPTIERFVTGRWTSK